MTDADIAATNAVRVLEERITALDRVVHVQFEANRKEIQAALHGNEKRVNNIYNALDRIRDQLNLMVTSDEFDRRHGEIEKRVGLLELTQSRGTGIVVGVSITVGLLIGGFVALALHLFG